MKKLAVIIISLILTLSLFAACSKKEVTTQDETTTQNAQNVAFDCTKTVPSKAENADLVNIGTLELEKAYSNSQEVANAADFVIRGKVEETEFVLDGSTVFTKSTVLIEESYKGSLKKGAKIFVKELGGFVDSDIYANAVSVEKYGKPVEKSNSSELLDLRVDGYKVMEKGESVVLFLVKTTESELEQFKKDTFEPIRAWQGKLLYHEEIDAYAPFIPKAEKNLINSETFKQSDLNIFTKQ